MKQPFLSIGIPTYKRPHRLRFLLEKLSEQLDVNDDEWEVFVSDNCSKDDTETVVKSFTEKMPNLRYVCNNENIGGDRNIRSVFDKGLGEYIWSLPDDDWVSSKYSVRLIIDKIKSCPKPPAFVIVNAKIIELDTNRIISEKINQISSDIYLEDGKDIISILDDNDLIGVQRFIIKKGILPQPFADNTFRQFVLPVSIALSVCAIGPAFIIGEPLAVFGDGDPTSWRKWCADIALQRMPLLLLESVDELSYSAIQVQKLIQLKKITSFGLLRPDYLLFQRYGIKWRLLSKLYTKKFVISLICKNIPLFFIKGIRKMFKKSFK